MSEIEFYIKALSILGEIQTDVHAIGVILCFMLSLIALILMYKE